MIVTYFKQPDGWWYKVTGLESSPFGATYFSGPYLFKFLARWDYRRQFK